MAGETGEKPEPKEHLVINSQAKGPPCDETLDTRLSRAEGATLAMMKGFAKGNLSGIWTEAPFFCGVFFNEHCEAICSKPRGLDVLEVFNEQSKQSI